MTKLPPMNFALDSALLDRSWGFEIERIEQDLLNKARAKLPEGNHHVWGESLHQGNQSWVGLDPQTLQTPYAELKRALDFLSPSDQSLFVDLGAGYGRLGLVLASLYPHCSFVGFEYVRERVEEGCRIYRKWDLNSLQLIEQDLTLEEFTLPIAQYYFIYDFGKVSHIRQTLSQLSKLADHHKFHLIARGLGTRSLIEHELLWLSAIYQEENFSIYSF